MLYYFALKIAGMAMSVFGTNYTVFVIGRFCLGCGHVGYHHPGFVLGKIYTVLQQNSDLVFRIGCNDQAGRASATEVWVSVNCW